VRAFSHLLVDRIASRYILKRYTRDYCIETTFDRYEKMFLGLDEDTTTQQARSILSYLFKLQRSAIMSTTAMERVKTLSTAAITEHDKIPHDVSLPVYHTPTSSATST
jgi:lipopolysaccharide biosynthesis regulator YciM